MIIVFWLLLHLLPYSFGVYETNTLVNLTLTLIKYYPSSCITVIHKKNLTEQEEYQIFRIFKLLSLRIEETVGIYSYDYYINSVRFLDYQSQNCLKPLKYVIGEESSREEFSRLTHVTSMSNNLWLITLNSSVTQFFATAKTPFNTEIIVAKIQNKTRIEFQEIYRVDDDFPLRTNYFGIWTMENGLQLNNTHIYARRFDLEGKLLKAGAIENWPMSSFARGKWDGWDGYYPRIWKELENLINCTTKPIRSVDNATGVLKSNGSWNGLVGMTLRGELDVIVSEITMNDERSVVLGFSRPVLISNYQVFFCALGSNLKWSAVLNPFSKNTWFAVCGWIVAGTLVFSVAYKCIKKNFARDGFTPTASFFFMLQSLCQQGCNAVPKLMAGKIIFLTSYLLSAVLIPSYSAWLIYSLTHHTLSKPFNSFEEFLSKERYQLNVIRNSAQQTYFKRSMNNLHRSVYSKVRKNKHRVQSVKEGLERSLCHLDYQAFFGVEAIVKMHLEQSNLHSCCQVTTFSKSLSPVYQSLAFLKESPYGELINYKLQRLFTTGIIDNIQKHFQFKRHMNLSYKEVQVDILDVFQIFALFFIGVVLSILFLLYEKFYGRKLKNKKIKSFYHQEMMRLDKKMDKAAVELSPVEEFQLYEKQNDLEKTKISMKSLPLSKIISTTRLKSYYYNIGKKFF